MSDHTGHRARVRARYINEGLEHFQPYEVLELLLFYCYPRCDTKAIAKKMLAEFGSLHQLFEADVPALTARLGCSENVAIMLTLMPHIANRYIRDKEQKLITFKNAETAGKYAMSLFVGKTRELFYVICVDARSRLNRTIEISRGTLDETAVYPREVMKAVIQGQASAVIFTHNHPGGTFKPSAADLEITRQLVHLLERLNIPVLDHIIVTGDTYYSFALRRQHVKGY
jgi:DNA repair protein RadC